MSVGVCICLPDTRYNRCRSKRYARACTFCLLLAFEEGCTLFSKNDQKAVQNCVLLKCCQVVRAVGVNLLAVFFVLTFFSYCLNWEQNSLNILNM